MKRFSDLRLLLLAIFINPTKCFKASFQTENKMSEFLKKLIYNEFVAYTINIQISIETETLTTQWSFGDTIDLFLATRDSNYLTELGGGRGIASDTTSPYDLHTRVLFVDTFESLRTLIINQRHHDHDLSAENQHYYIILPRVVSVEKTDILLKEIMHHCLINFIVHLNVLVENEKGIIAAYTYYPYTEGSCRNSSPTVHNSFINGSLQFNHQTFLPKLNNLWQCPLLVVLSEEPPFVVFEENMVSGIDGFYLKTLASMMNFSIESVISEGTGKTSPDGVVNGAFKTMEDGVGDFMFAGSFCSVHRMARFASTTDYFTTSLRMIVKSPKPYSSLEILLFPFDHYTWLTLFLVLMGKWIGEIFWKRVSIGLASFEETSARFRILPWLFSILVLRSSYEGSIFKFLHNRPRRELPCDLEEALADGYKIVARSTYYTALKQFTDFPDRFIFVDIPLEQLIEEFNKREGKYALVTLGEIFNGNKSEESEYRQFVTIKKPILQNILCIYLPKFSFLTAELNRRIKQLKNYGHLKKLYEKSGNDDIFKKKERHRNDFNIMSLRQLLGAFELLAVLICIGVLVFFMELVSVKHRALKKFLEFFH